MLNKPSTIIIAIVLLLGVGAAGVIVASDGADTSSTVANESIVTDTPGVRDTSNSPTDSTRIDYSEFPIPALPFDDNPDPTECGIPQQWGGTNNAAWLSGTYEGEMLQPVVFLYDSHGRNTIIAAAPHGTEVEIVLFQSNPVLDYYYVRIPDAPQGQQLGWVPAPFLSREPIDLA